MIKNFNYKGVTVRIKTNILKDDKLYFGDKSIIDEIVSAYSEATFEKGDITEEKLLIGMYKSLATKGIKPYEIISGSITNVGHQMTDLVEQRTLTEE